MSCGFVQDAAYYYFGFAFYYGKVCFDMAASCCMTAH